MMFQKAAMIWLKLWAGFLAFAVCAVALIYSLDLLAWLLSVRLGIGHDDAIIYVGTIALPLTILAGTIFLVRVDMALQRGD